MRSKFYTALSYGTLVVDAYLALALTATRMMKRGYTSHLPPFGSEGVSEGTRFLVLLIATWTAVLAIGCLRANSAQAESPHAPGTVWFVLVLAIVWLPVLIDVSRDLFTQAL